MLILLRNGLFPPRQDLSKLNMPVDGRYTKNKVTSPGAVIKQIFTIIFFKNSPCTSSVFLEQEQNSTATRNTIHTIQTLCTI